MILADAVWFATRLEECHKQYQGWQNQKKYLSMILSPMESDKVESMADNFGLKIGLEGKRI